MKKFLSNPFRIITPLLIVGSSAYIFYSLDELTWYHYILFIFSVVVSLITVQQSYVLNSSNNKNNYQPYDAYQIGSDPELPDSKDNGNLGQTPEQKSSAGLKVNIKKLTPEAIIPAYAKNGDAGLDLIAISESFNSEFMYKEFGTGLSIEIPEGYVGFIFPRSSISDKSFALSNAVGVIDSGYRGEIKLRFKVDGNVSTLFIDKSNSPFLTAESKDYKLNPYKVGDKVAQLIILPYPQVELQEVKQLSKTERGESGYGHTGN